jgi:preprotein translocase subunit YajC
MTREVLEAGFVLALSASSGQAGNPLVQLIPFALVLGIFYFVVLLPMRRRQKKVEAFLSALKAGDRVITTGGLYGVITKVNEHSVLLQVAQNVRLEVARSAIVGYQGQAPVVEAANA